ncbi:hypothetical protein SLE2022_405970 [Rubroshorea leprosula]
MSTLTSPANAIANSAKRRSEKATPSCGATRHADDLARDVERRQPRPLIARQAEAAHHVGERDRRHLIVEPDGHGGDEDAEQADERAHPHRLPPRCFRRLMRRPLSCGRVRRERAKRPVPAAVVVRRVRVRSGGRRARRRRWHAGGYGSPRARQPVRIDRVRHRVSPPSRRAGVSGGVAAPANAQSRSQYASGASYAGFRSGAASPSVGWCGVRISTPPSARQPLSRDRKFMPSTSVSAKPGDTTTARSCATMSPSRSVRTRAVRAAIVPLAVRNVTGSGEAPSASPAARAVAGDSAVTVAPLSISIRLGAPSIFARTQ